MSRPRMIMTPLPPTTTGMITDTTMGMVTNIITITARIMAMRTTPDIRTTLRRVTRSLS